MGVLLRKAASEIYTLSLMEIAATQKHSSLGESPTPSLITFPPPKDTRFRARTGRGESQHSRASWVREVAGLVPPGESISPGFHHRRL